MNKKSPLYFILKKAKPIDASVEHEILKLYLSMSDDPEFLKDVALSTHVERIRGLKKMGFTLEFRLKPKK